MAPEFFSSSLENEGYTHTVDIYAVGILLFEILVGLPPFGYQASEAEILKGLQAEHLQQITEAKCRDLIAWMCRVTLRIRSV